MSDEEKCTEGEFSEKFEELRWNLLNAYRPTLESAPQAFLLGGQSGAGKTTLHKIVHRRLDGNGISINGDDYRKFHPRFLELQRIYGDEAVNYTAPWAGRMTEALIDSLSRIEYNLVIEGTLRTAEVPLKTAELLRQRSYGVSLALMAVKPEISLVSCQIRYEEIRVAGTTPGQPTRRTTTRSSIRSSPTSASWKQAECSTRSPSTTEVKRVCSPARELATAPKKPYAPSSSTPGLPRSDATTTSSKPS